MDFGLVLQTDPPGSAVVDLMRRAERTASATAGPSTRRAVAGAVRDLQRRSWSTPSG